MTKKKSAAPDLSHIAEPLRGLAVDIELLRADPDNAVIHDARSIATIQRSLERFGQDQPLVVQQQGMIVRKGNGRLAAAHQLGWEHVAAVVVDEGDLAAAARAIADNRSSEFRTWDYAKVVQIMQALEGSDEDAEAAVGWDSDQLAALMTADEPDEPADPVVRDAVPTCSLCGQPMKAKRDSHAP